MYSRAVIVGGGDGLKRRFEYNWKRRKWKVQFFESLKRTSDLPEIYFRNNGRHHLIFPRLIGDPKLTIVQKPTRLPKQPEALPIDNTAFSMLPIDSIWDALKALGTNLPCLILKGYNSLSSLITLPVLSTAILTVLFLCYLWSRILPRKTTLPIPEFESHEHNKLFSAILNYLATKKWDQKKTNFVDTFQGTRFSWKVTWKVQSVKNEDILLDVLKVLGDESVIIKAIMTILGYSRRYSPTGVRTAHVTCYLSVNNEKLESYLEFIRKFLPPEDGGGKLRITNLYGKIRKSRLQLQVLFSEYGPVKNISITVDREAGIDFVGIIDFVYRSDAVKAMKKLDGCYFHHLNLKVEWAA